MSAFHLIDTNNVIVSMTPDFARVVGKALKASAGDNPAVFAFASQIITDANEIEPDRTPRNFDRRNSK